MCQRDVNEPSRSSSTVSSTMLTGSITGESSRKPRLGGQRNAMAGLRNPDQLRPAMAYTRALPATGIASRLCRRTAGSGRREKGQDFARKLSLGA